MVHANSQKTGTGTAMSAGPFHQRAGLARLFGFIIQDGPQQDLRIGGDVHRSPAQPAAAASLISSIVRRPLAGKYSASRRWSIPDFLFGPRLHSPGRQQLNLQPVARMDAQMLQHFLAKGHLTLGGHGEGDGHGSLPW